MMGDIHTGWFDLAKSKFSKSWQDCTAKTDKNVNSSVLAVGKPADSGSSACPNVSNGSTQQPSIGWKFKHPQILTIQESDTIRGWLSKINERDPEVIADVLARCGGDPEARQYFLRRAWEEAEDAALESMRVNVKHTPPRGER